MLETNEENVKVKCFNFADLDFDLMWKVGVLKSSRRLLIPDVFYRHVSTVVKNVGQKVVEKALDFVDSCANAEISFMADVVDIFDKVVADLVEIEADLDQVYNYI